MKFNHPIEIDFFEWLTNGKFDYLKFGQTKEWIVNNFPDPDNYGGDFPRQLPEKEAWMHPRCTIWKYGDIEMHFHEDNTLYMIFCDGFIGEYEGKWRSNEITGGPSLELDKWIFKPIRRLTIPFVMETLLTNGMHFTTCDTGHGSIELTIQESNFSFHFIPLEGEEKNIKSYRCDAFWMKEKEEKV